MKKTCYSILIVIGIILLCSSCSGKYPEGGWQLVRSESVENGKTTVNYPGKMVGSEFKIWSDRHFMFVGRWKQDSTVTDNYGYGSYTLDGTAYEETVLYHFMQSYQGKKIKMTLELKGDTMIQVYHPLDIEGGETSNVSSVEKYVRLK